MIAPWERRRKRLRFSIKLAENAGHGLKAHGWAVYAMDSGPTILDSGDAPIVGSPVDTIVALAIEQQLTELRLYRYANDERFAESRAAAEGMTRADHTAMVLTTAKALRERGFTVDVLEA